MSNLIPYLRARLAERSSRIQLLVLALLTLVLSGVMTIEQIHAYSTQILGLVTVLGPLAGLLIPDSNSAVDAASAQDKAVAIALDVTTQAAEKAAGPEASAMAVQVAAVVEKLGL
jgi:hypothetical protein